MTLPVSTEQKVGICFFKCPNTKCNCFTFVQQRADQNKHTPVLGYLDFPHLTCEETRKLSVDKGKQTDCLGRGGGRVLFSTQTHTNIVTLAQAGTQTHIPSEPSKEAA